MKTVEGYDVLGRYICPGDYIVYGALKGRCAGLNIGRVTSVQNSSYRAKTIQVEWGEYRQGAKEVTLSYSERICIVRDKDVPPEFVEMLK